ncbi:MAG TPA: T9SS type A sorting domain-containing protein [Ignavibacteria bacterium]|nr:T9SS type A sorting domain-containing protein [Ignavibacteria bacterium]
MKLPILLFLSLLLPISINAQPDSGSNFLNGNNISTPFFTTGVFDQGIFTNNTAGFEWPIGSGKTAIFTAGLTIAAKINGQIKMAAASYTGEYAPGYIINGVPNTNNSFKMYKVKRGDNQFNNPDYANWGLMVPYGAPYIDVNNNGIYEASIDTPGVSGASQTLFLCMTDGFPENHSPAEGFGGGTSPLNAEIHMTAWCYNTPGLQDVQFIKWDIINKSGSSWDGAIFSIVSDPDLGDPVDDYVGCDINLDMGFCYNADNNDSGFVSGYGVNPPAVGIMLLKTPYLTGNVQYGMSSFIQFKWTQAGPLCEYPPDTPIEAYNFMKGLKKDGTKWVNANTMNTTKYIWSGDPETGSGWNESDGKINNCGGDTTGAVNPSPPGDKRMVINTGDTLNNVNNGQMVTIVAAQLIARGSSNLNSVTKLKQLTNTVQNFWQTIGINPISSEIPESFTLEQNYPNPFNPSTKIRFSIPKSTGLVKLSIYDIAGKEVARLVNEELQAGVYEYDFNGDNLSSGMYFYRLETRDFFETRKMVLVK